MGENKAIILHSIEDAKHCVKNKLYHEALLFSTHSSVDAYLKESHNLECRCLSKFLSTEEIIYIKNNSSRQMVDGILEELDSKVSPLINNNLNLKMRYFAPLYSYLGKHHLICYICFVKCIERMLGIYKLNKILFYDYKFCDFLNTTTDIKYLISLFFGNLPTEIIRTSKRIELNNFRLIRILIRIKKLSFHELKEILYKMFLTKKFSYKRFRKRRKTLLLVEPLYELEFLRTSLRNYNILYYNFKSKYPSGIKDKSKVCHTDFINFGVIKEKDDPFAKIFLKDTIEDFLNNIYNYLGSIISVKEAMKKYPVSLGIWGAGPIGKTKAMIFEYLQSENIKILGGAHGGVYANCYEPWHFDTDFNRCNYFLSYGFNEDDLRMLYPSVKINTKILPCGKVNSVKIKLHPKKIDILFPITMNFSMFNGGMARVPPDRLSKIQMILLEYLNSQKGLDIYVKPLRYPDYRNCSMLPIFNRLRNLKIVDNITLEEFLAIYSPNAVLIEFPSQPLFVSLLLNTEIFLLGDIVQPFGKNVLDELQRRVHYSERVEEIISKLDLFLKSKLESKRDSAFLDHYLKNDKVKENILSSIESLCSSNDLSPQKWIQRRVGVNINTYS